MSSQPSHGVATPRLGPDRGNGAELDLVRISPFPVGSQPQLSPAITPLGWGQREQTCLPACLEQGEFGEDAGSFQMFPPKGFD